MKEVVKFSAKEISKELKNLFQTIASFVQKLFQSAFQFFYPMEKEFYAPIL